jgi:hypothetical protein
MIAGQKIALINRLNPSWQDLDSEALHDRQEQEISRSSAPPRFAQNDNLVSSQS